MTKYDYEAHLAHLRELYRVKSALALRKLDECLVPNKITYNPFEGGLFMWCTLPDGVDMPAFCKEAVLRKVCVVPGQRVPDRRERTLPELPHQLSPRRPTSSLSEALNSSASWPRTSM